MCKVNEFIACTKHTHANTLLRISQDFIKIIYIVTPFNNTHRPITQRLLKTAISSQNILRFARSYHLNSWRAAPRNSRYIPLISISVFAGGSTEVASIFHNFQFAPARISCGFILLPIYGGIGMSKQAFAFQLALFYCFAFIGKDFACFSIHNVGKKPLMLQCTVPN